VHIRVVAAPPGEEPLEVRRAWVGTVVQVTAGQSEARKGLRRLLMSRSEPRLVYVVDAPKALASLEEKAPLAGEWWREHAPGYWQPGQEFHFPAEICEQLADDSAVLGVASDGIFPAITAKATGISASEASVEGIQCGPSKMTAGTFTAQPARSSATLGESNDPPILFLRTSTGTIRVDPILAKIRTGEEIDPAMRLVQRSFERMEFVPTLQPVLMGLAFLVWGLVVPAYLLLTAVGVIADTEFYSIATDSCWTVAFFAWPVLFVPCGLFLLTARTRIDRASGEVRASLFFRKWTICRLDDALAVQVVRNASGRWLMYNQLNLILSGPRLRRIDLQTIRGARGWPLHNGRRLAVFLNLPLIDQVDNMCVQAPNELPRLILRNS
jgi:hypothetical protein